MNVGIDARISSGGYSGGVEHFIAGLIGSLGRLGTERERYLIAVSRGDSERWLRSYLGPNQELIRAPMPPTVRLEMLARMLGPMAVPLSVLRRRLLGDVRSGNGLPFLESFRGRAEVVHFPHQRFARTDLPCLYNPHDLQHLHYPEFFSKRELQVRSRLYEEASGMADAIAMDSEWAKDDLVRSFDVDPSRVYVVKWGPATEFYPEPDQPLLTNLRAKYKLPERFVFYPARPWPHKNHLLLVEAIHLLKARGLNVAVVCTGRETTFAQKISERVRLRGLEENFISLGYVSRHDLRGLYRLATAVVFPSLFEGGGFPVLEAFLDETPLVCSRSTAMPEYAGRAAAYFDPSSPEDIAEKLESVLGDERVQEALVEAGRNQLALFSWDKMAKTYRALYRLLSQADLDEEDRILLDGARGGMAGE